ncbi:MAG: DUF1585 domain-containing protein [Polyangiales bacterium]
MRSLLRALPLGLALLAAAPSAQAKRSLTEYRWFRALSIDLQGRIPSKDEVATFEKDGFDADAWIDGHLAGPAYAERIRRIYMDLLRLEIGKSFQFVPRATVLRRIQIQGPDGKPLYVYFRAGQRRAREETDGDFCLTQAETGLQFPPNTTPTGTAKSVDAATLDANTVLVKPWWLYRDYRSSAPKDLVTGGGAMYAPVDTLINDADGTTPVTEVRVCKEEASTATSGTVYATKCVVDSKAPPPYGRMIRLPSDTVYAKAHAGESLACGSGSAYTNTLECGCGVGLERCMPGNSPGFDPAAFNLPQHVPVGADAPTDVASDSESSWSRFFWGEEAKRFLDGIVADDRDFRDVLLAKDTVINGPLAQFYKSFAPASCCGASTDAFGYVQPDALFDPSKIPAALTPNDVDKWTKIDDRGAHASGILTMPVFLTKYGSRRGRAHVLYQAFLCRDFVAGNVKLTPSTEPNLMIRDGCSTCHATLEPLASYFTRVVESDWTFLPQTTFPIDSTTCKGSDPSKMSSACKTYYDPAFSSATQGLLRGAYGSKAHADEGPSGIGKYLTDAPEFSSCVVSNVASSFLGRQLGPDDAQLQESLVTAFDGGGHKMRALVRALVKADAYRNANDLTASAWRASK